MPQLVACGGRGAAYEDFVIAHRESKADFVALWIDSEEPVTDLNATWDHLRSRDGWERPDRVVNEQVLFSTTCMETLIIADHAILKIHFHGIQESALPSLIDLEKRNRHYVQDKLTHATRNCSNAYSKGKRSFEILGKLNPEVLEQYLPSFVRICHILEHNL